MVKSEWSTVNEHANNTVKNPLTVSFRGVRQSEWRTTRNLAVLTFQIPERDSSPALRDRNDSEGLGMERMRGISRVPGERVAQSFPPLETLRFVLKRLKRFFPRVGEFRILGCASN